MHTVNPRTNVARMRYFFVSKIPRVSGCRRCMQQGVRAQRPAGSLCFMIFLTPRPPKLWRFFLYPKTKKWGAQMHRNIGNFLCNLIARKIHHFFFSFTLILVLTASPAYSAGYSCPTYKKYTSCNSGYYMVASSSSTTHTSTAAAGNACIACSNAGTGCTCAGGTAAPVCSVKITLNKNGGSGTCGGASSTTAGSVTCTPGSSCTLPSWSSSTCSFTNGNKIFKGWSTSSTATSGVTSITPTAAATYYAVWVTPTCSATNGSCAITAPSSNAPRATISCSTGYSQSGGTNTTTSFIATGTSGATSVSGTCKARTYVVTFNTNSATSGSPSVASVTCTYGSACTAATQGTMLKTNSVFGGWNTNTGGTGTNYSSGGSIKNISTGSNVTLYAKWTTCTACSAGTGATCTLSVSNNTCTYTTACKTGYNTLANSGKYNPSCTANTYTVAYNANGGSGTTASSSHTYDEPKALTSNGFTNGVKKFMGWSTSSTATSATYTNGQSVSNLTSTNGGTVTLYAVWGTCTACSAGTGATCTLSAPKGVCTYTTACKTGYNTLANSGKYNPSCTANTYTVAYNINCPSGVTCSSAPSSTSCIYDQTFTFSSISSTALYAGGYKLTGCASSSTGTAATSGSSLTTTNGGSVTRYAIWSKCAAGTYHPAATGIAANTCSSASKGYYVGSAGATGQTVCAAGKYTDSTGKTSCSDVNAGYYNTGCGTNATGSVCSTSYSGGVIAAGYYGGAGATSSTGTGKVLAGYYSTGGGTSATPTAAGNGCLSSYSCGKVSAGCYGAQGATSSCPTECAVGSYSAAGASACIACTNGKTTSGTGKTSCDATCSNVTGAYGWATPSWSANTVSNLCTVSTCATKYYKSSNACTLCSGLASGFYPNSNNGNSSGTSACYTDSLSGQYIKAANDSTATDCTNWTYKGSHTVNYGSTSTCDACLAEPSAVSGVAWTKASGTKWTSYSSCVVSQTPANCASGSVKRTQTDASTWGSTTLASTLKSNAGYYASTSATACTAAGDGYYALAGATSQTACATGSYSTKSSASSSCTACPAGRTTSGTGTKYNATANTACATTCGNASGVHTWASPSWSANTVANLCAVSKCNANTYYTATTGSGYKNTCTSCGSNSSTSAGNTSTTCTCTTGYTADGSVDGASTSTSGCSLISDIACAIGYYLPASSTTCSACTAGYWCPSSAKTYSYSSSSVQGRTECSAGTYQPDTGQTSCLSADAGYYVSGTAKTEQTACTGATYAANTGQSSCTACPTATNNASKATGYSYWNTGGTADHTTVKGCYVHYSNDTVNNGSASLYYCYADTDAATTGEYGVDGTSKGCWVYWDKLMCDGGYYNKNYSTSSNYDFTNKTIANLKSNACISVGAGYWSADESLTRTACTSPLTTIGYGAGANEATDCGRKLHAGDNVIYLRSAERTSPSLRVMVGEDTFYGALSTSLSGALKVKNGSTEYSVVNDYQ